MHHRYFRSSAAGVPSHLILKCDHVRISKILILHVDYYTSYRTFTLSPISISSTSITPDAQTVSLSLLHPRTKPHPRGLKKQHAQPTDPLTTSFLDSTHTNPSDPLIQPEPHQPHPRLNRNLQPPAHQPRQVSCLTRSHPRTGISMSSRPCSSPAVLLT